jgi:RNA polymerase sigma factor (sigma-70 family)
MLVLMLFVSAISYADDWDDISDEDLAIKYQQTRSPEAFAILYKRYYSRLSRRGKVEDAAQDAFVKFWEKPELYERDRGPFRSWINTVRDRFFVAQIRTAQKAKHVVDFENCDKADDKDERDLAEEHAEELAEELTLVFTLINKISCDNVLYLVAEGLSGREIASRLSINEQSVRRRIYLARLKLKKMRELKVLKESFR